MRKLQYLFILACGWVTLTAGVATAAPITVIDSDGNGQESVSLSGINSFDPDGAIIDYIWLVNGVQRQTGFGPKVSTFTFNYGIGTSTVALSVRDDARVSSQTLVQVVVLAQSSNLPPVANATVPSSIQANVAGAALLTVNASASSDPENNPIIRYRWSEGTTTYFDGVTAITSFTVTGVGAHNIMLTVYSQDNLGIIQMGSRNFSVNVLPFNPGTLAGRNFTRIIGQDFAFTTTYEDYAGITFNALTNTFFMTDNKKDKILEIDAAGTLLRTIDIVGIKNPAELEADAEGITWMYGTTFAIVMEGGEEMAVAQITSATTALTRAGVTIYDLSGDPKGVTYKASEDALYFVSEDNPMRVVKAKINSSTGQLDVLSNIDVTGIPASALADVAYFPRLSQNLFLISHTSKTILEVDLTSGLPVVRSSFSIAGWDIPEAGAMAFGPDGRMYVVGKHVGNTPEDDFNVFSPVQPILNVPPSPQIQRATWGIDLDGNGSELVSVNGSGSIDPDGAIVTYEWRVNGVLVMSGHGPNASVLSHPFPVGISTVTLSVFDDIHESSQTSTVVEVKPQNFFFSRLPRHPYWQGAFITASSEKTFQ